MTGQRAINPTEADWEPGEQGKKVISVARYFLKGNQSFIKGIRIDNLTQAWELNGGS